MYDLIRRRSTNLQLASLAALSLALGGCPDGYADWSDYIITVDGKKLASQHATTSADGWQLSLTRHRTKLFSLGFCDEGESVSFSSGLYFDSADARRESIHLFEIVVEPGTYGPLFGYFEPNYDAEEHPLGPDEDDLGDARTTQTLYVEGSARRAGVEKRFAWHFDTPLQFFCPEFVNLGAAEEQTREFQLHPLRIFGSALGHPNADLIFDAIAAADSDGDGEISQQELERAPMDKALGYQLGGNNQVKTLWQFLSIQVGQMPQLGDRGCVPSRRDRDELLELPEATLEQIVPRCREY